MTDRKDYLFFKELLRVEINFVYLLKPISIIMKDKAIQWGWHSAKPIDVRSKEHQAFLINKYNTGRPLTEQVKSMAELNRALLTNEIKNIKD